MTDNTEADQNAKLERDVSPQGLILALWALRVMMFGIFFSLIIIVQVYWPSLIRKVPVVEIYSVGLALIFLGCLLFCCIKVNWIYLAQMVFVTCVWVGTGILYYVKLAASEEIFISRPMVLMLGGARFAAMITFCWALGRFCNGARFRTSAMFWQSTGNRYLLLHPLVLILLIAGSALGIWTAGTGWLGLMFIVILFGVYLVPLFSLVYASFRTHQAILNYRVISD